MSDKSFSLSTTADVLLALGLTEALGQSESRRCWDYGQIFFARARSAEADGKANLGTAWRLLAQLCQATLQQDNPDEPFQPMYQMADGRSLIPSDIDQVSADAVHQLGVTADDPEIKARLLDITWERLRKPDAARQAVHSYIAAARHLFDPEHWVDYHQRIERALRLARRIGDQGLVDLYLRKLKRNHAGWHRSPVSDFPANGAVARVQKGRRRPYGCDRAQGRGPCHRRERLRTGARAS